VSLARARLEEFEEQRRRATDFAHLPPANLTHGADPYALARLDAQRLVGVLRGASALVVLDNQLRELERVRMPESVVAVAVTRPDECWVGGETSGSLVRYRFDGHHLTRVESRKVPGIFGVRALAAGVSGVLYALDGRAGRLLTLRNRQGVAAGEFDVEAREVGHGPLSLERVANSLIVDLLLEHALVVYRLGPRGEVLEKRARVAHDGPIWGFDAAALPEGDLLVSATGV
jgi:hypothetical protein